MHQKGYDLLLEALPRMLERNVQFVLLGMGDSALEQEFRALAERFPSRVSVQIRFDDALAHRIEGGADVFLMPSRFEPCGLNQLYSLRYGTLPLVHAVGGLNDSIREGPDGMTVAPNQSGEWRLMSVGPLAMFDNAAGSQNQTEA